MGFYSRILFPWGCDLAMSKPQFSEARRELLAGVTAEVLEIGFGSGLNLPHYPATIRKLTAVDVNPGMHRKARKRLAASPIAVDYRVLNGEELPMPDHSFDSVVSTWTLCSIKNVGQALGEIRRVLKPEGRFFFLEHGLSNASKVQRWQHWLTPLQRIIGDGCHLNRNIRTLLEAQGFRVVELKNFYMEGASKVGGYTYQGTARHERGFPTSR